MEHNAVSLQWLKFTKY